VLGLTLVLLAADPQPPPEGHFIVDQTSSVSPQAKADVDELALTVHAGGFGELAVLVVDTTAGVPARKFATKVFSTWPVGHAENVDGALLLLAVKDKACALVLGDGFVAVSTKELEVQCAARLKEKEPKLDEAVRQGARSVLRLLEDHKLGARKK
jgi:uncharacterized membrane protein YgcG